MPAGGSGGEGGFPDDGVASKGGGGGDVEGNTGKVKGGDGKDEAVQGAVVGAVPGARAADGGLVFEDFFVVGDVKTPEVYEFAGGVDFGLVDGFGLAEHGGGINAVAPGASEEVGGFEEDTCALFPGEVTPCGAGTFGRLYGSFYFMRAGKVDAGNDVVVGAGHGDVPGVAGVDVRAVYDARNLYNLRFLAL